MTDEEAKKVAHRAHKVIKESPELNLLVSWLKERGKTQPSAITHGMTMIFDCVGCNIELFESFNQTRSNG